MQKYFNKYSKDNRGFTIIELIVVVAIIAVLASIVLVNVTGYINQGKDAAIKANLSSLTGTAAKIFDQDGIYFNICSNMMWYAAQNAIYDAGGTNPICYANYNNWCAQANLKSNSSNSWCVDSTGRKLNYGGCDSSYYICLPYS